MTTTPSVKILVCYHKPATLVKSEIFVPIHAGRAQAGFGKDGYIRDADLEWLHDHMIGDNTGDHISEKTLTYSELTALYWAWKNYDELGNPDYIGLMHYRRIIAFNEKKQTYNFIHTPFLSEEFISTHLNSESILRSLGQHDIILYKQISGLGLTEGEKTRRKWDYELQLFLEHSPLPSDICNDYLNRKWAARSNLMVMKRDMFFEYCSFLFSTLDKIEPFIDKKVQYYKARDRVYGRIGEWALGMWAYYKEKKHHASVKYLPAYLFEDTSIKSPVLPAFPERNIAICSACDNNYVLPIAVMIKSLQEHASPDFNYDLIILDNGLSEKNISKLKSLSTPPAANFSLRFYKMHPHMYDKKLTKRGHRSATAYCKLFVPGILKNYDKALYLDADTLVLADVAALFSIDINDKWVGAALDYSIMGQLRNTNNCASKLSLDYIGLDDALFQYVNAGVLLLNLAELRKNSVDSKWEATAASHDYENMERDVLNQHILGHVHFLDTAWNVPHNMKGISYLPRENYAQFTSVDRLAPKIIHYATSDKPWKNPSADMAHHWWSHARTLPFYEEIVYKYLKAAAKNLAATATKELQAELLRDITRRTRLRLLSIWYRLRALTTFGKLRQHYQKKKLDIQNRLAKIKEFIEGS